MANMTLVEQPATQGDWVAQLYAEHRLGLIRLAILLVDDLASAEDVVHDVFAGVVHNDSLRDRDKALAYLRQAVVNRSRSALRRRKTARAYSPPGDVPKDGPDDLAVLEEEHRAVLAAMSTLSTRQREVLVLRYWSDLSEAQISETLGISRGTVKSTASRALALLEKNLEVSR